MAKHIPLRMCVGCRQMQPKHELIKIVKADGALVIDRQKKMFGRGAYLCQNRECIALAQKKRALERSFRGAVPKEFYEELGGLCDG